MKKLKILVITLMLFIGIKNIYAFDNTIKVYDYAQILTEKEENKLKENVNKYISKYNIDMVIVTVKHYTQVTVEEYINLFYSKNQFDKDGIIFVLDLKNDDISIKTFGNATNYYSDNEVKNMLNKVDTEKNYYDKLFSFIEYSDYYVIKNEDNSNKINSISIFYFVHWIGILIPSFLIPTIIIVIGLFKNKTVKKEYDADYYILENSVIINTKEDKFRTTNTKKERINK